MLEKVSKSYRFFPDDYFNWRSMLSLTLKFDKNGQNLHTITYITHLFIHSDYKHLYNNLLVLFESAYPVYHEFGAIGVYCLFFGGGVASAIPSFLHDAWEKQFYIQIEKEFRDLTVKAGYFPLPEFVQDYVKSTYRQLRPYHFHIPTRHCGSSGAISAIHGCYFTIFIRDICIALYSCLPQACPVITTQTPPLIAKDQTARLVTPTSQCIASAYTTDPYTPSHTTVSARVEGEVSEQKQLPIQQATQRTWVQYYKTFGYNMITHIHDTPIITKLYFIYNLNYNAFNYYRLCNESLYIPTHCLASKAGAVLDMYPLKWSFIRFSQLFDRSFTKQSAHVQGFLSGVAFGTVFGILVPAYQRYRQRRYM